MTDQLKNCPFCGSRNVNDTTPPPDMNEYKDETYYWACPDCVCCGPITETLESATEAWNIRHIPEGYKLVPIDPTNANVFQQGIWAFEEMMDGQRLPDGNGYDFDIMERIYKAMIEAIGDQDD